MLAKNIVLKALSEGRNVLLEPEAYNLLSAYNIHVCKHKMVSSLEDALKAAREIGYPVVLKIVSPDIVHKSDVGGVKINILNDSHLRESYETLMNDVKRNAPNARILGVLVVEMAPKSVEVVVGMLRDPTFGPTVMFGLGGIFVELMKDVVFRIAPVTKEEALEMIKKIKGYPLLSGFRGSKPLDINSIAELISTVSRIGVEIPEIDQMDLNPIIVYETGFLIVDARVILKVH
ncbi:MAG: acetate--CoA ligase family protein [Nitrososphaeria archaeon]|nr:acetate--CoA ligase family protein [Nitrososphaeria archaeon]